MSVNRCQQTNISGWQCFRLAEPGRDYCFQHPLDQWQARQAAKRTARAVAIEHGYAPYPAAPPVPPPVVIAAPPPVSAGPGCVDCGAPLLPARCRSCASQLRVRQLEVLREAHLAGGKLLTMIHLAAGVTPETCPLCRSKALGSSG